ncbi:MAG: hypothetical protein JO360_00820 [Acidobacteria bacterium]|nr:hypothetical protein [Acidobacteriota bacterium]
MKRTLMIFGLMIFVLMPLVVHAQQQQSPSLSTSQPTGKVAEIEVYSKEIDAYVKSNEGSARIFAADDSSAASNTGEVHWRTFKSEQELQAADPSNNLNSSAYVWLRDGKVVGASFTLQSASRDWVQYVMYYFRRDGTVAKISSTLNTFRGSITVKREDYYNSKGTFLKGTTHCNDLKTQQAKPCGNYEEMPAPLYQKVSLLPFYNLLKQ